MGELISKTDISRGKQIANLNENGEIVGIVLTWIKMPCSLTGYIKPMGEPSMWI